MGLVVLDDDFAVRFAVDHFHKVALQFLHCGFAFDLFGGAAAAEETQQREV
jgi:hypothetical protein